MNGKRSDSFLTIMNALISIRFRGISRLSIRVILDATARRASARLAENFVKYMGSRNEFRHLIGTRVLILANITRPIGLRNVTSDRGEVRLKLGDETPNNEGRP